MTIEWFGAAPAGPGGRTLPFTKAVRAGDFVFVSGQVPMGPDGEIVDGGIVPQTRRTLDNVIAILAELGLALADVVKVTGWLADTRDFWPCNNVYNEDFGAALADRPGPVLAYCRSGTRSATLWALSQSGKRSAEEILGMAADAGYDLGGIAGALGPAR